MKCPVCGVEMTKITFKKNPKGPDWKCSDRNCKFEWDKETKDWIPSDYITSVWDRKPPEDEPKPKSEKVDWEKKDMRMAKESAHKSACMLYEGTGKEKEAFEYARKVYEDIWNG